MGTEAVWMPMLMTALSAGAQMYNTRRTENKQDAANANAIRSQARIQREADARVNEETQRLEQSRSESERAKALESYGSQLRTNRAAVQSGLVPNGGSDALEGWAANASQAVDAGADKAAGLMARMDAPAYQRMNEGFSRGMLATDLDRTAREAQGRAFLDDLRLRSIRRNPWLDAGAQALGAFGSAYRPPAGASRFGPYASGYKYPGGT